MRHLTSSIVLLLVFVTGEGKMKTDDCIFCKIIAREIPATVVAEDENILVIEDIAPKAPVHYLLLPKKHIPDIASLEQEDISLSGQLFLMARDLFNNTPNITAFRLVVNNGSDAGQQVFHLHIHFLAGSKIPGMTSKKL